MTDANDADDQESPSHPVDGWALEESTDTWHPEIRGQQTLSGFTLMQFSRSGPLPAASELEAYELVLPGVADRIVSMAEREQSFRHDAMNSMLATEAAADRRGTYAGLTVCAMALALAAFALIRGYPGVATAIVAIDLVALATIFVLGRRQAPVADPDDGAPQP